MDLFDAVLLPAKSLTGPYAPPPPACFYCFSFCSSSSLFRWYWIWIGFLCWQPANAPCLFTCLPGWTNLTLQLIYMFGNQSDSKEYALNGTVYFFVYFLNINNLTYDVVLILSSLDMTLAEKHTKSQRWKKQQYGRYICFGPCTNNTTSPTEPSYWFVH